MSATAPQSPALSAECTVAKRSEYEGLHANCRQTEDVPLPHSTGILLQQRCGCSCHRPTNGGADES